MVKLQPKLYWELAKKVEHKQKVQLILDYLFPGDNVDVPDPYYGTTADFQEVYTLLDHSTDVVISKIKNGTIR